MSEAIGPIAVDGAEGQNALLPGAPTTSRRRRSSSSTPRCAGSSTRPTTTSSLLLGQHRDQLESLTRALLDHETLDEAEAYEAAGVDRHAVAPTA